MTTHPGCNQYGHAPGCTHVAAESDVLLVDRPWMHEVNGDDLPPLLFTSSQPFDPDLVEPVTNRDWGKPAGGLWLSPGSPDSESKWDEFRRLSEYGSTNTHRSPVGLSAEARVLVVDSRHDFWSALTSYRGDHDHFDFEAMAHDYDALWVTSDGIKANHLVAGEPDLYGWDFETVLVLRDDNLTH